MNAIVHPTIGIGGPVVGLAALRAAEADLAALERRALGRPERRAAVAAAAERVLSLRRALRGCAPPVVEVAA